MANDGVNALAEPQFLDDIVNTIHSLLVTQMFVHPQQGLKIHQKGERIIYSMYYNKTSSTWNCKCSLAVNVGMNKSFCWTYPEILANMSVLTSSPLRYRSPLIFNLPVFLNVRQLRRAVFPAPLAPIIARNSPGWTHPVTNRSNRIDQMYGY